jgi:hypothetical protein
MYLLHISKRPWGHSSAHALSNTTPVPACPPLPPLAVHVASFLAAASSRTAFPASYLHEDGGAYRGEWRGLAKEGLGVYTYTSGARYEGACACMEGGGGGGHAGIAGFPHTRSLPPFSMHNAHAPHHVPLQASGAAT